MPSRRLLSRTKAEGVRRARRGTADPFVAVDGLAPTRYPRSLRETSAYVGSCNKRRDFMHLHLGDDLEMWLTLADAIANAWLTL